MALTINLTTSPLGTPLEGAYLKINLFTGTKSGIIVQKLWYASEAARRANAKPLWEERVELPLGDVMAYLYTQLKAAYPQAVNC